MKLFYIDESKSQLDNPYLFLGGVIIGEEEISSIEDKLKQIQIDFFGAYFLDKSIELHGKEIFHGKGHYKTRSIEERIGLFEKVANLITQYKVPIRISCVDANQLQKFNSNYDENYKISEYSVGMHKALHLFSAYLKEKNDIGLVFADHEENEMIGSIDLLAFFKESSVSPYKVDLTAIKDNIYYTHSHHSRFLQVADLVLYMANRYENIQKQPTTWHDKTLHDIWQNIKNNTDFYILKS